MKSTLEGCLSRSVKKRKVEELPRIELQLLNVKVLFSGLLGPAFA